MAFLLPLTLTASDITPPTGWSLNTNHFHHQPQLYFCLSYSSLTHIIDSFLPYPIWPLSFSFGLGNRLSFVSTNIDYLLPPMCSVPRLLICNEESFFLPSPATTIQVYIASALPSSLLSSRFWAEEACLSSHHLSLSKAFKLTLKKNPPPQRNGMTAFHYLVPSLPNFHPHFHFKMSSVFNL